MEKKDRSEEELRKQAFLEYQKTGVMNEIVRAEMEAYAREANKGLRRGVLALVWCILTLYLMITALCIYQCVKTASVSWGIVSAVLLGNLVILAYIVLKRRKKKDMG